jgi:hypothetical protein
MSKTTTPSVWFQLRAHEIRLIELLHFYERTFTAVFPSQEHLAKKLHVSVRTVRRAVSHLRELGLLVVQARRYRDRQGRVRSHSNVYKLLSSLGAKLRGIVSRLTGRPRSASATKTEKKEERLDLSFVKNEKMRELLAKFGRSGIER